MIKKLQKLKAKKGFTLVELIVVIAIIGVLAAILIPTMLGFVTSSRVTSANTTAAELQKQINNFLTDADTAGYGMKKSNSAIASFTFKIADDGTWGTTLTESTYSPAASDAFKGTKTWGTEVTGVKANEGNKSDIEDATELMTRTLADVFPDVKSSYASMLHILLMVLISPLQCPQKTISRTAFILGTVTQQVSHLTVLSSVQLLSLSLVRHHKYFT